MQLICEAYQMMKQLLDDPPPNARGLKAWNGAARQLPHRDHARHLAYQDKTVRRSSRKILDRPDRRDGNGRASFPSILGFLTLISEAVYAAAFPHEEERVTRPGSPRPW